MGTTDRRGGLVPKHLDSGNLGTEIDSLNFTTEWQDGPSFARRTVTNISTELTPELCDGPAVRTVTVTTGRHEWRNSTWVEFLLKFLRGVLEYL